ncbi:MAG: hypothetical protein ACRDLS_06795 [Solirubrobacteraceae bacterium]
MLTELPIACSLSAPELSSRLTEMARLGRAALHEARRDGNVAVLTFTAGAGVRDRVAAVVAAESKCCPFFAMSVTDEPGAVVLTIGAPEGAEPALETLVEAFGAVPAG